MPDQPPTPPDKPESNAPDSDAAAEATPPEPAPPAGDPPPAPPATPPVTPPPQTPPAAAPSGGGSTNTVMLVLSYVWILALIPLLTETDDADVQWHSKNGIVLMLGEIALWVLMMVLQVVPVLGTLLSCGLFPLVFIAIVVIRILCIVKAVNGEKLRLPVLDGFVEQWK